MVIEDVDKQITMSIEEISPLIKSSEVSPVALTQAVLDRIDRLDPKLHSYAHVMTDSALQQATKAEQEIKAGRYRGPLQGIPVGVKDLFFTKDVKTRCGSTICSEFIPDYNATVVTRLINAGAVITGKQTMTEFAYSGYHPDLPHPLNPWNLDHSPSVSSGGSGTAVAASLCFGALGTDTGGSVRMPAAACGISSLKPTFGAVSRYGVFPLSSTMDHVGMLTRAVSDLEIMFNVVAGYDINDPVSVKPSLNRSHSAEEAISNISIGIDRNFITENVDPEVSAVVLEAAACLEEAGAELQDIDLSCLLPSCNHWKTVFATDSVISHAQWYPQRAKNYGPVFKENLEFGLARTGQEVAQAHIAKRQLVHDLKVLFEGVDLLLCPTVPSAAPAWDRSSRAQILPLDQLAMAVRFSAPFNFSGNPCLAIPCGFNQKALPLSFQLVGRWHNENTLFSVGKEYQRITDWHKARPSLDFQEELCQEV